MSGGSYNYTYITLEHTYCDQMYDTELDEMMKDLVKLLHDLEWWQSADIDEKDYRETVTKFKSRWFKRSKFNVKKMIDSSFETKKNELYESLKYLDSEVENER